MKIAIFGATGKTGGFVLEQALCRGWEVSALARFPEKLARYAGRVRVIAASNDDAAAIRETINGSDAVISAMGSGNDTLTRFGPLIVAALDAEQVSRFVSLIGASIYQPGDPGTLNLTMLRATTRLFAGSTVTDGHRYTQIVSSSDLDYTLVRPPRLTMASASGRIMAGSALKLGPMSSISRADLGAFMADAVANRLFIRDAPMVAGAR